MKFTILYDPDKHFLTQKMFEETVKNREIVEKVCDFWVGGTRSSFSEINFWLKRLEEKGFEERFLFPAKPCHALSGKYAKYVLRPELLNVTSCIRNPIARIYTKIGKIATRILYPNPPPFMLDFGYLILGSKSSVGKFTGSKEICDEDALEKIKNYLDKNKGCYAIYLEAGSGSMLPITKRLKLVEKTREIVPEDKVVYCGGGIKRIKEVLYFLDLKVHPVISTHFEKNPKDIYNFAREVYKRA